MDGRSDTLHHPGGFFCTCFLKINDNDDELAFLTGHEYVFAAAVTDDIAGLTLGQTARLRVVLRRFAVSERTR